MEDVVGREVHDSHPTLSERGLDPVMADVRRAGLHPDLDRRDHGRTGSRAPWPAMLAALPPDFQGPPERISRSGCGVLARATRRGRLPPLLSEPVLERVEDGVADGS